MKLEKKTHYHQYTIKGTPGLWPPLNHHVVVVAKTQKELHEKLNTPKVKELLNKAANNELQPEHGGIY